MYFQLVNPERPVQYRRPIFHMSAPCSGSTFSDQDLGDQKQWQNHKMYGFLLLNRENYMKKNTHYKLKAPEFDATRYAQKLLRIRW